MHFTLIILWNIAFLLLSQITLLAHNNTLNENEIKKNIEYITKHKNINNTEKEKITEKLKSALYSISKKKYSEIKIKEYQNVIDNFYIIIQQLYDKKKDDELKLQDTNDIIVSSHKLRQYQLQINQKLIKLNQELQQAENLSRSINESLILYPQQHTEIKKNLNEINHKISSLILKKKKSHLEKAELIALENEKEAKQSKIAELELAQLSAHNRQAISRLQTEILKKQYNQLDKKAQILHIQLHNIQKQETAQTIQNIETSIKKKDQNIIFPKNIIQQLETNRKLSQSLKQQINHINLITLQQREITSHTLHIRQTLSKLLEQSQWINKSPALGEILRAQILKLPKPNTYKSQKLDSKMAKIQGERLQYEEQINKLSLITLSQNKNNHHDNTKILTHDQKKILNTQIKIQKKLLNSLLTNCDIQIIELTKLKISYEQFEDYLKEIEKITQRYLLWIPDLHPINLSYAYKLYQDLRSLLNMNNLFQLKNIIKTIFLKNITLSILFLLVLLLISYNNTTYHYHYYLFLIQSKKTLQTTHENYFSLTLQNIFWSNIMTIPILTLWIMIGYILSHTWEYSIISSIGDGILFSTPILWILIITIYFTSKNGLFSIYFNWEKKKIMKAFHFYMLYIPIIIFFLTTIITFNNYHNGKFYNTLSRFCFIILCIFLTCMKYNIKKANLPLYINKNESSNNIINYTLWNFIIISPIISIVASCMGYLSISQKLLMHIEITLIILFISSIIYHTIKCWALTQKNKIIFKHKKNNKKNLMEKNIYKKNFLYKINNGINITYLKKKEKNTTNLDTISNQSLQLIRLILNLITFSIIFFLWSEFHFIFKFLETITIWDIKSSIQHVNNIQPITLKTLLITFLIFFITTKITKNSPSLLKLIILQHLNLTPGSNYAITTITKYTLMFLGVTIGLSYIGIEWSKLQWLIAAIGVGLGFGLQEIFANFISGLIILFEQPIRIGDTITISNFTGKITQINTRAATIIDRDHKEIIIPNKEFITKKFINWSLSDTITRVVIKIPGPVETNITQIIQILLEAVTNCPLVLKIPEPEIFLINIEKGIPLFEIRIYTNKVSNRTPLRHQIHILIIYFYEKYGLSIPFPHIHIHN